MCVQECPNSYIWGYGRRRKRFEGSRLYNKIMLGLQATKRWGPGLHRKHFKAPRLRPSILCLYFACKSLLVKYLPNYALVLNQIDHCDKKIHRLLNLRYLLSKTKALSEQHTLYSPCRDSVLAFSKFHVKFWFLVGEIKLDDFEARSNSKNKLQHLLNLIRIFL